MNWSTDDEVFAYTHHNTTNESDSSVAGQIDFDVFENTNHELNEVGINKWNSENETVEQIQMTGQVGMIFLTISVLRNVMEIFFIVRSKMIHQRRLTKLLKAQQKRIIRLTTPPKWRFFYLPEHG